MSETEKIKEATEKLTKVFYEMSEKLYKAANPNGATGAEGAEAGQAADAEDANNDGTVYDADYKVEDDENK